MAAPGESRADVALDPRRPFVLILAAGAGVERAAEAALSIADRTDASWRILVLLELDEQCGFRPRPSTILVPGMPAGVIAAMPKLEECGVASRLASPAGWPGCHEGSVTELAELWLADQMPPQLAATQMVVLADDGVVTSARELGARFGVSVVAGD